MLIPDTMILVTVKFISLLLNYLLVWKIKKKHVIIM